MVTTATDKIFVLGGTGNIGTRVVTNLLAKNIPTTVYTRNPAKVVIKNDLLSLVQGDYADLTAFKDGIKDHTRLLLLITDLQDMVTLKKTIAEMAYAAGVKQIIDISSLSVSACGRASTIAASHSDSEDAIYHLPGRSGTYVVLRPARFMVNAIRFESHAIKTANMFQDVSDEDIGHAWVSTNDIADVATTIFQDPVEKHGNLVYEMVSEVLTPAQRAEIYTNILKRPISYQKATLQDRYNFFTQVVGLPHAMAYDMIHGIFKNYETISPAYTVLIGRPAETFEYYIEQYKEAFSA